MNKPFRFKDRNEYINYLKAKEFPALNIIFIDDSSSYDFYQSISKSQFSAYYGSFLNDSTEVKKTDSLKANLSCAGRILDDININIQRTQFDSSLLVSSNFKKFVFKRLDTDEKFEMNSSDKQLKIVMIYGYSLGSLYDSMYKEIIDFYEKNKNIAELYIVSLDPVNSLP